MALQLRAIPDADDPDGSLIRIGGRLVHNGKLDPDADDIVALIKQQREERALHLAGLTRGDS